MEDRETILKEIHKPDKQNSCEIWIDINHTLNSEKLSYGFFMLCPHAASQDTARTLVGENFFTWLWVSQGAFITCCVTGDLQFK